VTHTGNGGAEWHANGMSGMKRISGFESTSKRRKGYPSEQRVKRGDRYVHGDKELEEKLGRKDMCPCGSGRWFQEMLHEKGALLRVHDDTTIAGTNCNTSET